VTALSIAVYVSSALFSEAKSAGGTNDALTLPADVKRDPFWPVGYVPESVKNAATEKGVVKKYTEGNDWNGAMKKVVINGVSSRSDNEFFAVVNGEVRSLNETVSVTHAGITYTWVISSIKPPGSVRLRRVSAL
jgi:hypothetical protein